jgi:Carboxypeptidase regulatory-like domain
MVGSKVMNGVKVACLLLASAAMSGAQVVEGAVSNSVTRIGVSDVRVQLQKLHDEQVRGMSQTVTIPDAQLEPAEAITDVAGKFRIEGLKEGKYNVTFFRDGFSGHWTEGPLDVKTGDPLKLELNMIPLGQVSGRILDNKGHPLGAAKVMLLATRGGSSAWNCDEDGIFTIPNVGAGTYTLMAYAANEAEPPEPVEEKQQAWAVTYYPGTVYADGASRLVVSPGGDVRDLELKLVALPVRQVSGVVLNTDGKPVLEAAVETARYTTLRSITDEKGRFSLTVVDGTYRLTAQAPADRGLLRAAQDVFVSGKDVSDVELRLAAPYSVHGTLLYDPPLPPDTKQPAEITLTGRSNSGTSMGRMMMIQGQTFMTDLIDAGSYTLLATPVRPYYLASVRVNGQDGLAGPVYLGAANDTAEMIFRKDGGTVAGNVEDCKGGTVNVIPMLEHLRATMTRSERCDAGGNFSIPYLRPGDYYLFAVKASDAKSVLQAVNGVSLNSTWDVTRLGTKVTVRAGESTRADLKVTKLD